MTLPDQASSFPAPGPVRLVSLTPWGLANDLYRGLMVVLCSVGLMVDRILRIGDTYFTYCYCHHMDRMTYFRTRFHAHLAARPARIDRWKQRQVWVDDMPDMERLAAMPPGSLGRSYHEAMIRLESMGLPNLRPKRLKALRSEAKGLDLGELAKIRDPRLLFERLVARRNIYMTSSHDFFHMLAGCNTRIAGEALVARYQYRHLLVPQNFLNMVNSLICHFCLGRWRPIRTIRRLFAEIDRTRDFTEYDWESAWTKPLEDVREELGLPRKGYMPDGVVPGETW